MDVTKKRRGGVRIKGGKEPVDIRGDVVGRDKVEQHDHVYLGDAGMREEKSGCVFWIERATAFVITLFVSAIVLGVFMGGGGALIGALMSGGEDAGTGAIVGGVVAALVAIGISIANAANVSRYRSG
jgi:hypothetical protein